MTEAELASAKQVRLMQEGEMWQKPGGRALRFTATQSIAVERVAFSWEARFPLLGPVALRVVDGYADGDGGLEVRLLRVPLQRQRGPQTAAGEALRYLAELPFAPPAFARNHELEWRELGDRRAEVATRVAGERVAVTQELDDEGDVVTAAAVRLLRIKRRWSPTPWGGRFGKYETLGGMRLPTSAEAFWDLPEGRWVYWRATVTSATALDEQLPT